MPVWWQKGKCHTIDLLSPSSLVYVLHMGFKCPALRLGCHVHHKTQGSRLQPSGALGLLGDRAGGTSVKIHIFTSLWMPPGSLGHKATRGTASLVTV